MASGSANWELDNDEIASIASEDLHDNRPNRWKGPKSTWRALTEEDRLLWHSMKQLQDQDLAVHLYDAFALKRRGGNAVTAPDLMIKTEDGREAVWAPPKFWTAWPLKERQVPKEGLIKSQNDEDERFTFRKREQILPSTELEEELSATILRTAKNRFRRKKGKMAVPSLEVVAATAGESGSGTPGLSSREESAIPETEAEGDDEEDDEYQDEKMQADAYTATLRIREEPKSYEPVVSTNDDLSYELLRPSVRHILSHLDATLTILHNSRTAGLNYLSDSSTEDESDSQSGQKRARGRPRAKPQPSIETDTPNTPPTPGTRKRGRPRKIRLPRDGETHEEMLLRIAREGHRRLPTTPQDKEAAFEEWIRKGDETIERERSLSLMRQESEGVETEDDDDPRMSNVDRKRLRWGLRDWSNVLGAAALAGFSSEVIERTTRRCADLFGEGMVVRKLTEAPIAQGTGIETKEYRPEAIRLMYSSSDPDSSSEEALLSQRRVASRQASLARSSHSHSPPSTPRGRRSQTPRSPAPSRSGSSAGLVFCPISSCDRAAQGFSRKANLRRHMELVHQGQTEEVDSDEEVVGGVHVDGFLRTIVPGRGWRGDDVNSRRRKRFYGERVFTGDGEEREDESS
ncbi:Fc.00g020960.m01.CDS01 [Cosmosporella sp. VM-42]